MAMKIELYIPFLNFLLRKTQSSNMKENFVIDGELVGDSEREREN
jgi:hypothetical protein